MYYKLREKTLPLYFATKYRRWMEKEDKVRIINGLVELRKELDKEIPDRTVKETLLLATWNIRDFGGSRLNPSPRLTESLFYIAEIISSFDLVAMQEVNENMFEFLKLMEILGPSWKYIATDVTEGRSGNSERMAFLYDSSKVIFQNIAGEIVLDKGNQVDEQNQFARSPFLVKFQIGWLKFNICTVHLYYGDASGEGKKRRVAEIAKIGEVLHKRCEKDNENYILLGDMNIVDLEDETFLALKDHDFIVPNDLVKNALPGSNKDQTKFYDQIAFLNKRNEVELGKSANNAGIFNYFKTVFKNGESETYHPLATNEEKWGETEAARAKYFENEWRTWQMSDHLPMWVELKIDFTDKYLEKLKQTI